VIVRKQSATSHKRPDVDHLWPTAFNIILTGRELHAAALAMPPMMIDGRGFCTGWARRANPSVGNSEQNTEKSATPSQPPSKLQPRN
jgi:hypothetical protein